MENCRFFTYKNDRMKDLLPVYIAIFTSMVIIFIFMKKDRRPWSQLSPYERRVRLILLVVGVILFLIGVIAFFSVQNMQ